jgi:hypothetical protein
VTAAGERRARRSERHGGGPGDGAVGEAAVGAWRGAGEAVGTQRRGRRGARSASGEREAMVSAARSAGQLSGRGAIPTAL